MAEAIAAELVKTVVVKTGSKIYNSIVSAYNIESKEKELEYLKNTIEAADPDSVSNKFEVVLAKIHDFQERKATISKQKEPIDGRKSRKGIRSFFPASHSIVSRFKDAREIDGIMAGLNHDLEIHAKLGSIASSSTTNQTQTLSNVSQSDHTIDRKMIGRDKDMDKIVSLLFDPSTPENNVSVASIVGMGGVGKTTLAKYVYNDNRIETYFDLKLWVFATQDFNIRNVLQQMVSCATKEKVLDYSTMEQLKDSLSRVIAGKRFLLVLDGVWDEVSLRVKWLGLRKVLGDGAMGSQVLLTTCSATVANTIGTHKPYMISDLSDDDCWLLFKDIAFTKLQEPGVEAIGKEISKMGPKLPLAIEAIGSHLAGKLSVREWCAFRNDQFNSFTSYGSNVINTLKLSYDELGERVKLCVNYCSLFPKGFIFEKSCLIRLWIAMEYVKAEFTGQSLEDAAENYMLCLLGRGFFYSMKLVGIEWKNHFRMHNLMHDLVLSVTGVKYKMADSNTNEFDENVRHVSFVSAPQSPWKPPSSLLKIKYLNTFLLPLPSSGVRLLQKIEALPVSSKLIPDSFLPLRVLRMHGLGITKLPNSSVRDLIHLRYLDLSFNSIRKLPSSITKLVNLYLLDLSYCWSLEELPEDIGKLRMLRHLELGRSCVGLTHMPNELEQLKGLETLSRFVVGKPRKSNAYSACGLGSLKCFVNLKGTLTIILAERSKDIVSEAKAINLDQKAITHFGVVFKGRDIQDEMVLDCLRPGTGLTSLDIESYAGNRLPCWLREGIHSWLPNLVEVQISNCQECIYMCSFGRLAHLKYLTFDRLEKVEYIENGDSSSSSDNTLVPRDDHPSTPLFPSLQSLFLTKIPALKGWWSVTDSAQDQGLNQLQKWMPVFPKLKEVTMDIALVISLAQVFLQRISSLRRLVVIGKTLIINVGTKVKAIQKSLPSNVAPRPRQPAILLKSYLPMLIELSFSGLQLVYLPEEFRGMPALEILSIYNCEALEAVPEWIDSLTSLRSLTIDKCPRIKSLPCEISNLSNLKTLILKRCSLQLVERCQAPSGEDWPKIQHIPKISIERAKNDE